MSKEKTAAVQTSGQNPAEDAAQTTLEAVTQPKAPTASAAPKATAPTPTATTNIAPAAVVVKSGDLMLQNLNKCTAEIKRMMTTVAKSFLYIGFRLWECKDNKSFEAFGYKNIYEYSEAELGFKRASTCNFINVCLRFSEKVTDNGFPSYNITKSAENFSYSQLVEMLSLSPTDSEKVNADMTVKDIHALKAGDNADDGEKKVQTSGQKKVSLTASGTEYSVTLPPAMSKQLDTLVQANRIPVETIFKDALKAYFKSFKANPQEKPSATENKAE